MVLAVLASFGTAPAGAAEPCDDGAARAEPAPEAREQPDGEDAPDAPAAEHGLGQRAWTVDVTHPQGASRWRGERISLSLRDADLKEVLRSFARLADMNLILDPRVKGRVTVELHDVPWDQALHVILKTHGLGIEIDGGTIWSVRPPSRR
ncbi:MAG TPA: secretin and TonB N-terminal domain-containing protein [Thermoanaerobaculia bacterium]|nr:secretin and TonB N-terminal domain-containing protein [Thermoanaerobaculia bacterium]